MQVYKFRDREDASGDLGWNRSETQKKNVCVFIEVKVSRVSTGVSEPNLLT